MIRFKEFLTEAVARELPWKGNPSIGWWQDREVLRLYHGTHESRINGIMSGGINAPSKGPTAGWVSMALEPNTSHGYASMSGESAFRAAGAAAIHIPDNERVVFVADIPMKWVQQNMNTQMRGNINWTKDKLSNKDAYEKWSRSDQEYYMVTELRFPKKIPARFIVGYMRKKKK